MQPSTLSQLSFSPGRPNKLHFYPQLMNKEKSLTTYSANQKMFLLNTMQQM